MSDVLTEFLEMNDSVPQGPLVYYGGSDSGDSDAFIVELLDCDGVQLWTIRSYYWRGEIRFVFEERDEALEFALQLGDYASPLEPLMSIPWDA